MEARSGVLGQIASAAEKLTIHKHLYRFGFEVLSGRAERVTGSGLRCAGGAARP